MNPVPFMTRLHIRLQRVVRWEFWPWQLIYFPIAIYWFFLAIRARGWVFFSAANPCMRFGGLVAYSKSAVGELVPKDFLPATITIDDEWGQREVEKELEKKSMEYPLIIKPDEGERGRGVQLIRDQHDLSQALNGSSGRRLLQTYVDLPQELGVLYSRHPDEEMGRITSIVIKEFPVLVGDGNSTLLKLMLANLRTRLNYQIHIKRFSHQLRSVPKKGEAFRLVHVGNHLLGTTFYNGNHLITTRIERIFDDLAKQIHGFHIGRFDIRTESIDELLQGNFVIIEVNGVNSEPCHIYDPGISLGTALRDLTKHWHRIFEISVANHARGVPYTSFPQILREIRRHRRAMNAAA